MARRLYYHLPDQGITKTDETLDVEVQLPEGSWGGGSEKGTPLGRSLPIQAIIGSIPLRFDCIYPSSYTSVYPCSTCIIIHSPVNRCSSSLKEKYEYSQLSLYGQLCKTHIQS